MLIRHREDDRTEGICPWVLLSVLRLHTSTYTHAHERAHAVHGDTTRVHREWFDRYPPYLAGETTA